MALSSDMMKN